MYSHHTRVTASQIGQDGYQTLVALINTMQDCSQFSLDGEETMGAYFKEHDLTLMLASRQVDIERYPVYGEALEVSSWIYDCKSAMGYRNTVIKDAEGATIAKSWSVGAIVSFTTGKLSRITKEVLASLTLDPKVDMEYLGRRIHIPQTTPQKMLPVMARPSDIDYNQHVNNVQFIRMATEHLPENFKPKRLRVEYKNQAVLGDEVQPLLYCFDDGGYCVELMQATGDPYAVVELT